MTQPKIKYLSCLCGAREDDIGQPRPLRCWSCGKRDGMKFYSQMIGKGE